MREDNSTLSTKLTVTTKTIDRGYKQIVASMREAKGSFVDIGLFGGDRNKEGTEIVTYGAANEFGVPSKNIPERSFIRHTVDKGRRSIDNRIEGLAKDIIDRRRSVKDALDVLGEDVRTRIVDRISTIRTPPLSPKTIERKKSSKPLIDTGAMREAIRHKVTIK